MKHPFQNFQVDHMTLLLQPKLYKVSYALFNIIFGVKQEDLLYEKRKEWIAGEGEKSLTFAVCIGSGASPDPNLNKTIVAVVQPSEPAAQPSHVREMLDGHQAASHWQHIALRTPDLLAFHKHAIERGVNFITPILKDDADDLIQVFSGEWFFPGQPASGMFFEFLQRNPSDEHMKVVEEQNREMWFRDKTFLGLYGEKEMEYQSGNVKPFIDFDLFDAIYDKLKDKEIWEITQADIDGVEELMLARGKKRELAK
jgi:hypothetical protein